MEYLVLAPYIFVLICFFLDIGDSNYIKGLIDDNVYYQKAILCHIVIDVRDYAYSTMVTSLVSTVLFIFVSKDTKLILFILVLSIIVYAIMFLIINRTKEEFVYQDMYFKKKRFVWINMNGVMYIKVIKICVILTAFIIDFTKAALYQPIP